MDLKTVTLYKIAMPLKTPFTTHLGTVKDREGIIVEVMDTEGRKGYGEGVAFSSPWYTEETVETSYHVLKDFLIPILHNADIKHPSEAGRVFDALRRNQMAKAALETALWDLAAKKEDISLSKFIGGKREQILSGVVVGAKTNEEVRKQIENFLERGYQRVKIKIGPENDYELISDIRHFYPDLPIMADANSAYSLDDIDRLKRLDDFGLMMIEQPLEYDDIVDHAKLQKELDTPICLDESIVTFHDARRAADLGSCKVINIKIGRVGGLGTAKKIHDYCLDKGIHVWCGGMLEFGISRAHNIALASLEGFAIPGDISESSRYWEEDITLPEVTVKNGMINVPDKPGIGFEINEKRLGEVTILKENFIL
ncbi:MULTISPECIES: o-succinylbenzoate synthase [unclassified Cytobacillus]|uniref:o-succinylbenzoate synthase n=1 Tax=unclassified Cytobacillus TaxID=2675268 RepID=UPI00203BF9FF|nr:o-succinylbenzoate synthase [Cytobacillus sp. AMY 15.2]MCM3093538.1 o-succinylbenzoate synthase [Cytobacillus sp. AMY 15.2]